MKPPVALCSGRVPTAEVAPGDGDIAATTSLRNAGPSQDANAPRPAVGRSRVIEALIASFSRRQARSHREIERASASSRTTISMPEATRAKRS